MFYTATSTARVTPNQEQGWFKARLGLFNLGLIRPRGGLRLGMALSMEAQNCQPSQSAATWVSCFTMILFNIFFKMFFNDFFFSLRIKSNGGGDGGL